MIIFEAKIEIFEYTNILKHGLSAARHAKFEHNNFQEFKIEDEIVSFLVSSEIDIYCNNIITNKH